MRRFDLLAADAFAYEWPRRDPPSSLRRPGSPSLCSMVDHLTSLLYVLLPWNWKTESEDVSIFAASRDQPISSGSNRFAAIAGRTGFAQDSSLEGDGFELSVPGRETVKPSWETGLLSRKRERIWCSEASCHSSGCKSRQHKESSPCCSDTQRQGG